MVLCQFALGSATFTISGKFCKVSLGVGILILITVSIIARFSMQILVNLANKYSVTKYYDLVKEILGKKFANLLNYFIVTNGFLGIALYNVVSNYKFILNKFYLFSF